MRKAAFIACLLPGIAQADIMARFVESAPKDRFELINTGCALASVDLTIDLSTAPAGIIFDVTGQGAGVEVFQPVEIVSGQITFGDVTDGDQVLSLRIDTFDTDETIVISADLDDLQANSALGQIRVSGSEIAGALIATDGQSAEFTDQALARLPMPGCLG